MVLSGRFHHMHLHPVNGQKFPANADFSQLLAAFQQVLCPCGSVPEHPDCPGDEVSLPSSCHIVLLRAVGVSQCYGAIQSVRSSSRC